MELLLVDDERRMLELLRRGLTREGHSVACAADGSEGLIKVRESRFDIVILDVMMPRMDGFEMAQRMRMEENQTPILMLTAKDTILDVVHGLDLGADDYIVKPFSFSELLLRLKAVNRRARLSHRRELTVGDLLMNFCTREVWRADTRISLTRTEYCLLEVLMRDPGRVVPRDTLIASLNREVTANTLEAFVRLLRNKIDCDGRRKLIHTVRGVGYLISTEGDA